MAAAYAALASLVHIIKQIQQHPRPPISLDQKQVDSLTENVAFLQGFLEGYSSGGSEEEDDFLESRIADAAHAVEDVIESHILDEIRGEKFSSVDIYQGVQSVIRGMDFIKKEVKTIKKKMYVIKRHIVYQIDPRSTSHGEKVCSFDFYQGLQRVMQDMDLIKQEVETIKEKMYVIKSHIVDQIHAGSSTSQGDNISSVYFYQDLRRVIKYMDFIKKEVRTIKWKRHVIKSRIVDQIYVGYTSHGKDISSVDFNQGLLITAEHDMNLIQEGVNTIKEWMDLIKSHVHARYTNHGKIITSVDLYQGLQRVIQDMDLIKKDVETINEKMGAQHQLHRNSSVSTSSATPASTGQNSNSTIVDFGDIFIEVMDKLTGEPNNLQIIPIVGMGGIGKTTLARNIYANPLIVHHFEICVWITISQEYSTTEILQVLCEEIEGSMNDLSQKREDGLGERLHKNLWGRRYLIVMDDIWSTEAWDKVKLFFPNNNNGSRIMMTTRLSNLVFELSGFQGFHMEFLDEDRSWNLLCKTVFDKERCPIGLENIGKKIAKNCRGHPLSIVVIGGLLRKFNMTPKYWEYSLKNLYSLINLGNNELCLQILFTSYKELPIHLKPCFLYMGVFPEDDKINVSMLIKLWVAEGFLRPVDGKSMEIVAEGYFKELVDRNLILVHELHWNGKVRLCKIHDLLRDLCIREAQKQKFFCTLRQEDLNISQDINIERRICVRNDTVEEYSPQIFHALRPPSLIRSLLLIRGVNEFSPSLGCRLLRVCSSLDKRIFFRDLPNVEALFRQANMRYLSTTFDFAELSRFPCSWSLLWNLQTLKVAIPGFRKPVIAPSEIWMMPLLRHAILRGFELPDPPCGEDLVLENMQTLSHIWNLKCSEEVVKRIPNIMKLKLKYNGAGLEEEGRSPKFCHNNLGHLQVLESFDLRIRSDGIINSVNRELLGSYLGQNIAFPDSLKKLTLKGTNLYWEKLTTNIGSLPSLEVLHLRRNACMGPEWVTVEGQFCRLKFLLIKGCYDLKYWTTDSTHFPLLEHLILNNLQLLEEIPSSIGDITTLQSIQMRYCRKSAEDSAERIKEEQEGNGNVELKVQID